MAIDFTPGQSLTPEQLTQLRAQAPHRPVGDMVYHPSYETPLLTDAGQTSEFSYSIPTGFVSWASD